jgi:hypothetical protein
MLAIALCVSLVGNLWLWRGWNAEQDGREADKAAYVKAQKDAAAKQHKLDLANTEAQTERNKELENAHAQTEIATRGAVADYIARNRLRPTCRPASGAGKAGVHPDPAAPVEASPLADMVAVSPTDLDKLATGAVRGAECTGFLNGLIAEGLAKAAD